MRAPTALLRPRRLAQPHSQALLTTYATIGAFRCLHVSLPSCARYKRSSFASDQDSSDTTETNNASDPTSKKDQMIKDAIADDIVAQLFEGGRNKSGALHISNLSSPASKPSNEFSETIPPAEPKIEVSIPRPDFASIVESEADVFEREEKLRLKREARDRAKEMISELSEMAEISRAAAETNASSSVKQETLDDDWFVGQSYEITTEGAKSVETEPEAVLKTPNAESAQDDEFTPKWMRAAAASEARRLGLDDAEQALANAGLLTTGEILKVLSANRAANPVVLDIRARCDWTETMIIVEGQTKKQLFTLVDAVRRVAKRYFATDPSLASNMAVEGSQTDDWMVLDLGRVVLHVMTPEARKFYDLEGLWGDSNPNNVKDSAIVDDYEDANDDEMLAMVEKAWQDRPITLVKTKQLEAEDLLGVEDVKERMTASKQVFGRS
ncbi:hypothetical protein HDU78_000573 [Chytriomyces hyalinus]|nr:hypothetical protein HDU78_000573 [Chytriomyces hyalinus]